MSKCGLTMRQRGPRKQLILIWAALAAACGIAPNAIPGPTDLPPSPILVTPTAIQAPTAAPTISASATPYPPATPHHPESTAAEIFPVESLFKNLYLSSENTVVDARAFDTKNPGFTLLVLPNTSGIPLDRFYSVETPNGVFRGSAFKRDYIRSLFVIGDPDKAGNIIGQWGTTKVYQPDVADPYLLTNDNGEVALLAFPGGLVTLAQKTGQRSAISVVGMVDAENNLVAPYVGAEKVMPLFQSPAKWAETVLGVFKSNLLPGLPADTLATVDLISANLGSGFEKVKAVYYEHDVDGKLTGRIGVETLDETIDFIPFLENSKPDIQQSSETPVSVATVLGLSDPNNSNYQLDAQDLIYGDIQSESDKSTNTILGVKSIISGVKEWDTPQMLAAKLGLPDKDADGIEIKRTIVKDQLDYILFKDVAGVRSLEAIFDKNSWHNLQKLFDQMQNTDNLFKVYGNSGVQGGVSRVRPGQPESIVFGVNWRKTKNLSLPIPGTNAVVTEVARLMYFKNPKGYYDQKHPELATVDTVLVARKWQIGSDWYLPYPIDYASPSLDNLDDVYFQPGMNVAVTYEEDVNYALALKYPSNNQDQSSNKAFLKAYYDKYGDQLIAFRKNRQPFIGILISIYPNYYPGVGKDYASSVLFSLP